MATVEAKVYVHHYKNDGTCNVKIRVYHKNETKFIDTSYYVSDRQVKKHPDFKSELLVKDPFVKKQINIELDDYRIKITNLGTRIKLFSCQELKDHLSEADKEIDFVKFCADFIEGLKVLKKNKSAANFNTVRNSLIDFFRREIVLVTEIDVDMLFDWDNFLRTGRKMTRVDQYGRPTVTTQKPCTDAAVHNYMRDLRSLFNHARKRYNKKSLGVIKIAHYPFEDYEIVDAPETRKRNCDIATVKTIRYSTCRKGSRAELARNLFMLSFYMCGINASDLIQIDQSNLVKGRLEYNRSKTRDKRKDQAFISILVVRAARFLLKKYLGKLSVRYSTIGSLNKALSVGMRNLCKQHGLCGITFYWARHTVGNLGRNTCRMSKDDVALALNHVDKGNKTTDIYIEKDWKIVDELQQNVIKLLGRRGNRLKRLKDKLRLKLRKAKIEQVCLPT